VLVRTNSILDLNIYIYIRNCLGGDAKPRLVAAGFFVFSIQKRGVEESEEHALILFTCTFVFARLF
jgi:hypothetical protein